VLRMPKVVEAAVVEAETLSKPTTNTHDAGTYHKQRTTFGLYGLEIFIFFRFLRLRDNLLSVNVPLFDRVLC